MARLIHSYWSSLARSWSSMEKIFMCWMKKTNKQIYKRLLQSKSLHKNFLLRLQIYSPLVWYAATKQHILVNCTILLWVHLLYQTKCFYLKTQLFVDLARIVQNKDAIGIMSLFIQTTFSWLIASIMRVRITHNHQ